MEQEEVDKPRQRPTLRCFRCGALAVKSVPCWDANIYWPRNIRIYMCAEAPACPNLFLEGRLPCDTTDGAAAATAAPASRTSTPFDAEVRPAGCQPGKAADSRNT